MLYGKPWRWRRAQVHEQESLAGTWRNFPPNLELGCFIARIFHELCRVTSRPEDRIFSLSKMWKYSTLKKVGMEKLRRKKFDIVVGI